MNEPYVRFESVNDLLRYLINRRGTERHAAGDAQVYIDAHSYVLDCAGDTTEGNLQGGQPVSTAPAGRAVKLNRLFELMPLQRLSPQHNQGAEAMVLAIPVSAVEKAGNLRDVLVRLWRRIPCMESARSAFYNCRNDGAGGWHAVRIEGLSPSFNYEQFRADNAADFETYQARVFAPAWTGGSCYLFTEWEYSYPRSEEFSQLYLDRAADLILCRADRPATGANSERGWWVPDWHVIRAESNESNFLIEDLFQVDLAAQPPGQVTTYSGEQFYELPKLACPLRIDVESELAKSMREVEERIGKMELELEKLNTCQERLSRKSHQEFHVVHRWEQNPDALLPVGLAHLLTHPLGELANWDYFVRQNEDNTVTHFVTSRNPMKAAHAATMVSDQIYLCDARWHGWNLPLYVVKGFTLSIDINEEAMAVLVAESLPATPDQGGEGAWLAEPDRETPGELSLFRLPPGRSLDEMVAVTNQGSAGPAMVARAAEIEAGKSPFSADVALSESALTLDTTLRQRAEAWLNKTEQEWEQLRQELQTAAFRNRLAEVAARPLAAACGSLSGSWNEFVEKVLAADAVAAHFKLAGLGEWAQAEPHRLDQLKAHDDALADVGQLIQERKDEYEEVLARARSRNESLQKNILAADQHLATIRTEQGRLEKEAKKLAAANAKLELQIKERNKIRQRVEEDTDRSKQLTEQLNQLEEQLSQLNLEHKGLNENLNSNFHAVKNWVADFEKHLSNSPGQTFEPGVLDQDGAGGQPPEEPPQVQPPNPKKGLAGRFFKKRNQQDPPADSGGEA